MPLKILDQQLLKEDELIAEVNRKVKSDRPKLKRKMFVYLRDVLGLIPKAIRVRTTKNGGGAAYYTPEALEAAVYVMTENWKNKKTLKQIKEQNQVLFKEAHIKSETFRQKYENYNHMKKMCDIVIMPHDGSSVAEVVEVKIVPASSNLDDVSNQLRTYLQTATKMLASKNRDEKQLDAVLDQISFKYQDRLRCRMNENLK